MTVSDIIISIYLADFIQSAQPLGWFFSLFQHNASISEVKKKKKKEWDTNNTESKKVIYLYSLA